MGLCIVRFRQAGSSSILVYSRDENTVYSSVPLGSYHLLQCVSILALSLGELHLQLCHSTTVSLGRGRVLSGTVTEDSGPIRGRIGNPVTTLVSLEPI
jgi:hypothetical protein